MAVVNTQGSTTFNARDEVVEERDPLGHATTSVYDAAGNLTSQTDAKGQTTNCTYDALNRVVQSLFSDGSRISYSFDAAGRQTAMQDGTGTTLTTFDALSRETSVRYGSGHTLTYVLDKLEQRTQMTDPDGGVTLYQNDASGRLTQLTNPQGETTRFVYDALDRLVQKTLANGVVESHTFDDGGRETKIEHRNPAGTLLASFASAYDAIGKRTSVTEVDGSTMSYAYDANGQLLGETRTGSNAYSINYTYDVLGNRFTKTENGLVTSYSYDGANQLQSQETRDANGNLIGQGTASYDLNGNVTQQVEAGQTTSFSWNPQNYLVGVTHPDGTSENYTYCGEGIRRTKTNSEGFRRFIRDGQNILLEVADTGGTLRRYTHQSDEWGTLLSLHQGQMSRFYGFDGIANTRLLSDENGNVSDSYLYSAFGEERQVLGSTSNPLRFGGEAGYYRDEAKRLYVRARHFDVNAGRWMSRDPIGFQGGSPNLYGYVENHVVNYNDPSGLQGPLVAVEIPLGGLAIALGVAAAFHMSLWACIHNRGCNRALNDAFNDAADVITHPFPRSSPPIYPTPPAPKARPYPRYRVPRSAPFPADRRLPRIIPNIGDRAKDRAEPTQRERDEKDKKCELTGTTPPNTYLNSAEKCWKCQYRCKGGMAGGGGIIVRYQSPRCMRTEELGGLIRGFYFGADCDAAVNRREKPWNFTNDHPNVTKTTLLIPNICPNQVLQI